MRLASLVVVAMSGLSAVGHAQAPGEVAPASAPPAPAADSVMSRPWSISLGLAAESAKADGAERVGLAVFELAGRYRARRDIEVGLSIDAGGGNKDNDALSTGGIYADFRYRFLAGQSWNVIGLASVGFISFSGDGATQDDKQARGAFRLGAGVERRFHAWALEADVKMFGVRANHDANASSTDTAYLLSHESVAGIALSFAATLYL